MTTPNSPVTPADPTRGICPTCGLYAKLPGAAQITNRIEIGSNGELDEACTDGGAHLERLNDRSWFLQMARADGSTFCAWIEGRVVMIEERPALAGEAAGRARG